MSDHLDRAYNRIAEHDAGEHTTSWDRCPVCERWDDLADLRAAVGLEHAGAQRRRGEYLADLAARADTSPAAAGELREWDIKFADADDEQAIFDSAPTLHVSIDVPAVWVGLANDGWFTGSDDEGLVDQFGREIVDEQADDVDSPWSHQDDTRRVSAAVGGYTLEVSLVSDPDGYSIDVEVWRESATGQPGHGTLVYSELKQRAFGQPSGSCRLADGTRLEVSYRYTWAEPDRRDIAIGVVKRWTGASKRVAATVVDHLDATKLGDVASHRDGAAAGDVADRLRRIVGDVAVGYPTALSVGELAGALSDGRLAFELSRDVDEPYRTALSLIDAATGEMVLICDQTDWSKATFGRSAGGGAPFPADTGMPPHGLPDVSWVARKLIRLAQQD